MTQNCCFIIADKPKPTKVTTTETDSGPTEQVSLGKKVYLMRKCLSRIIIVCMKLFIEYFKMVFMSSVSVTQTVA